MIRVDKLVKSYGGKRVVDAVGFEVAEGEVFGLLGPRGILVNCRRTAQHALLMLRCSSPARRRRAARCGLRSPRSGGGRTCRRRRRWYRHRPGARPGAATARPWQSTRRRCRRHSRRRRPFRSSNSIVSTASPGTSRSAASTSGMTPKAFWWQCPCRSARLPIGVNGSASFCSFPTTNSSNRNVRVCARRPHAILAQRRAPGTPPSPTQVTRRPCCTLAMLTRLSPRRTRRFPRRRVGSLRSGRPGAVVRLGRSLPGRVRDDGDEVLGPRSTRSRCIAAGLRLGRGFCPDFLGFRLTSVRVFGKITSMAFGVGREGLDGFCDPLG